jgi:hypothetical protein
MSRSKKRSPSQRKRDEERRNELRLRRAARAVIDLASAQLEAEAHAEHSARQSRPTRRPRS